MNLCSLVPSFGVPEDFLPPEESSVFVFASLVACRRILFHWQNQKPPLPSSWLEDLIFFQYLETALGVASIIETFVNSTPSLED